jgi:hypothetical protein
MEDKLGKLQISSEDQEDTTELDLYGYNDKNVLKFKNPQSISIKLIMDRNFPKDTENAINGSTIKEEDESHSTSAELVNKSIEDELDIKAKKLLKLTHVHLDRENIGEIDNLAEYLNDVTHLYLQHNVIKKIENLEFLQNLTFLVLSNNQITLIENIKSLKKLKLLDLSSNLIESIDVRELPLSIIFLDLRENTFLKNALWYVNNYEEMLQKYLVNLKQLNGKDLIDELIDENKDFPEENIGNMEDLQKRIIERSLQRQKKDISDFDNIWQKKKLNLQKIKESTDEKFRKS